MTNFTMWLHVLLTLVLTSEATSKWDRMIYVSINGTDSPPCLINGSTTNACLSLSYAASGLANSTRITLLSGNHTLNTSIKASRLQNIAITGMDSTSTRVKCLLHNQSISDVGLYFAAVSNLHIASIIFENCGALSYSTVENKTSHMHTMTKRFRSAVCVINATNVTITSTHFLNGTGIGVALFGTNGLISIRDSVFSHNAVPKDEQSLYPGGGSLYIEHTYCTPGRTNQCDFQNNPYNSNSTFTIHNCSFSNNHATDNTQKRTGFVQERGMNTHTLGKGAAISAALKGCSRNNTLTISNCTVVNNKAHSGGGIIVGFVDFSNDNRFIMVDSLLQDNRAIADSGALKVGTAFYDSWHNCSNHIYQIRQ